MIFIFYVILIDSGGAAVGRKESVLGRIRTYDLLLRRQLLFPAELQAQKHLT
jgi:hypothetical protein